MTPLPDLSAFGLSLTERLGGGASGTVYAATQAGVGDRPVAVKVFNSAIFAGIESAEREIASTIRLRHPNLVAIHAGRTDAEPRFLVLERADPNPPALPLPLRTTVAVGVKLCSALAVAHDVGIVHSDIKPDNILWHNDAEPLLSDFGSARVEAMTRFRADIAHTPRWSPPWIPGRPADRISDVWSLAASLIWYHWEWEPGGIRWDDISPDLRQAFQPAMPSTPEESTLGDEPALDFGRLLQQCEVGRSWPMTTFPVGRQLDWTPEHRRSDGTLPMDDRGEAGLPSRTTVVASVAARPDKVVAELVSPVRRHGRTRRWLAATTIVTAIVVVVAGALLATGRWPNRGDGTASGVALASGDARASTVTSTDVATDGTGNDGTTGEVQVAPDLAGPGAVMVAASDRHGNLDIYLHQPDGSVDVIVDSPGDDYAPSLSPDGLQVAFESNEGGTRAVYMAPVDRSTPPRRVSPEGSEAIEPAWSPDGDQIAWVSRDLGNWDIVIHDLTTATETVVVTSTSDDRSPRWSPDGASLVFRSDRTGSGDIYQLTLTTQAVRQVTTSPLQDDEPAVAADGSIALERRIDGDLEVFIVDPAGEETRVTSRAGFDGSPAWDGTRLVYVRRHELESEIVVVSGNEETVVHRSAGITQDLDTILT